MRGNVQIAAKKDAVGGAEIVVEIFSQTCEPFQFVNEFLGSEQRPVRHVNIYDPDAFDIARDESFRRIVIVFWKAFLHILDRMFRNDRDTVICFFTGKLDVLVTCRAKLPMRKTSIDALRLLQTQNIRLLSTTPIVNEPDPRVDAVYVPGGDLHTLISTKSKRLVR